MDSSLPDGSYLGVECGATRSVALLAPGGDLPCLRAEFGPANLRLLDDAELVEHFTTIKDFQGRATAPLAGIAIGMAGMRTDADRQRIRAAAAKVWPATPCYATNDLETALVAGESGNASAMARVLILSGTGSCCFGRKSDGTTLRFGGWGHILGDKGSGYEIGLRGLKASVHFLDREGRWPLLGRNILQALQMNEPEDLIDWAKTAAKSEVAGLAVQVFAAAAKGDKIARDILTAAAESLANDGVHCARRMVKGRSPVEFIFAGSILLKQPGFARQVRARLMQLWPVGPGDESAAGQRLRSAAIRHGTFWRRPRFRRQGRAKSSKSNAPEPDTTIRARLARAFPDRTKESAFAETGPPAVVQGRHFDD